MSVRVMARIWEHSRASGTTLLMGLGIGDFSDDNGYCYPSIGTLAEKCRVSPRQAIRLIEELEASGELEVKKGCGPAVRGGRLNLFRIRLENLNAGKAVSPVSPLSEVASAQDVTSMEESGVTGDMKGVSSMSPKPSVNHQKPSVRAKRSSAEQSFEAWYETTMATNPDLFAKDDPLFKYLERVGLSYEFFQVAWYWFKQKYLESEKRQKDWPKTLLNSVRNNYGRLWYLDKDQNWRLTSVGKQVAIEHELDPEMVAGKRADGSTNFI